MEQILPTKHFDCTEKLTELNEYFSDYAALRDLTPQDESSSEEHFIRKKLKEFLNCKGVNFESIAAQCSPERLTVEGEVVPINVYASSRVSVKINAFPEAANDLQTIKVKKQYNNINPRRKELDTVILKPDNEGEFRDVSFEQSLVTVRVYQPFAVHAKRFTRKGERLRCSHEIIALTTNLLCELRDKILCGNDNILTLEIDELKKNQVIDIKGEYPSGLIGIDDVLYIDMRHPNAVDYSEVIREWGVNKGVGQFKVMHMDQVQIRDLTFRIGYPYVYQHRGNCEHVIVFSDVRLVKKSDPPCKSKYPYYRSINRYNTEQCNICHSVTAKWMVTECDRLPHDWTFLCEDCFTSYNYIDGKKIGTFKAYPYNSKTSVK